MSTETNSIEKIVKNMISNKQSELNFDLLSKREEYFILKDNLNKEIVINDIEIGIKEFQEDKEGGYPAFIKIYLKNRMLDVIINKMKETKKNPIVFDIWNNQKEYNFLLNNKEKTIEKENYIIKIELESASGYGMGEEPASAKVYLLAKI